jgi:hypothetical protein
MDRRSAIRRAAGALGTLKFWKASASADPLPISSTHRVQSSTLTADFNDRGEITALLLTPERRKQLPIGLTGRTVLSGCRTRRATVRKLPAGGVEFRKILVHEREDHSCTLTERFERTDAGSVRWEIEILGDAAPWSTAIQTELVWPAAAQTSFWTTWGDSRPENSPGWNDPLMPVAFGDRDLHYGARDIWKSAAFSVPIATILDRANDTGLSLVLSPEDSLIELDLATTGQGKLVFSRTKNRIGKGRPLRFGMDLLAHQGDWRAAVGWMAGRYPQYFDAPNPLTHEIAGNAVYAEYEGAELDAYKLFSMGFRVNWKTSYDWYTMGMFLPPVGDDVEYVCPRLTTGTREFPTSISRLRRYSEQMRRSGFYVLNYLNTFEFGHRIKNTPPPPPRRAKDDADLWRDPNDLAFYVLEDALWRDESGKIPSDGGEQESVVMDPGVRVYQNLLLDQVRRHLEKLPASAGLCIDRMDFLRWYNSHRDDELTWKDKAAAGAFVNSWKDTMNKLGPIVHEAGKVVYGNPLYRRLDAMRHLDGFYDEFGYLPHSLNANAFLALRKPYVAWTVSIDDPDPDAYFQRHLHLGAYVTVPYPLNNHAIIPSGSRVDRYYVDYGPMFGALRGRTWILESHAVEVDGQAAKANLFAIPGGYVVAITFGGANDRAKVLLRGLNKLPGQDGFATEVLHPGETDWTPLSGVGKGDLLTLDVPLHRGCAMVKLSYLWIKPDRRYFLKTQTVTLGTTLSDAQLRYTLDGKGPTAGSALYTKPFTVDQTSTLKVAAFRGSSQSGPVLNAELVKTRPPAPWIDPFLGSFSDEVAVELHQPYQLEQAEVRYTLDGGDVTSSSPLYSGPIKLNSTATVRARTFMRNLEPGPLAEQKFSKRAPLPPMPQVHLGDLTPLKAYVQDGSVLKKDLAVNGTPLSMAGKKYERGLGATSPCELIYGLEPEYGSFVAIAGIDDAVRNRYTSFSRFRVYARNEREELLIDESPVLYPGEFWPIRARIPRASFQIRLTVNEGMDGERIDWVNAGFLMDENNRGAELLRAITK